MKSVLFITTQTGDDLVLSFAVQCPDDPSDFQSLTLIRTPKYEFIFDEHERGVKVTFERRGDDEEDLLEQVDYAKADAIVRLQTTAHKYALDVRKVAPNELKSMCNVLKKMNFDQRFGISGF